MVGNGWSAEGMRKFNEVAQQVKKDRVELGEEFNLQFKVHTEQERSVKQARKRKRGNVITYNDLDGGDKLHPEHEETSTAAEEFDLSDLLPVEEV